MIDHATADRLTRESGASDQPMLRSYLLHAKDERQARETIGILRRTHATIWQRRVTPREHYE